jgi:hypothetical protein
MDYSLLPEDFDFLEDEIEEKSIFSVPIHSSNLLLTKKFQL